MEMTTVWGDTSREGTAKWPKRTVYFRLNSFAAPGPGSESNYDNYTPWQSSVRPLPITWTVGRYQVPAIQKDGKWGVCSFPDTIAFKNGQPYCISVTGETAEEKAAREAAQKAAEAEIGAAVQAQTTYQAGHPKYECSYLYTSPWQSSSTKPDYIKWDAERTYANGKYAWRYTGRRYYYNGQYVQAYTKRDSKGGTEFYECSTDRKIGYTAPVTVRGLGGLGSDEASSNLDDVSAAARKEYRKTEILLGLALLAAAAVVMR